MTGTACFAKASSCWNDWLRTIVFAFNQPRDNMQVKLVRSLSQ